VNAVYNKEKIISMIGIDFFQKFPVKQKNENSRIQSRELTWQQTRKTIKRIRENTKQKKQGDRRKSAIILDPHERLFLILVDK
jgi:hypothetical protein